jgi:hypothetical protein
VVSALGILLFLAPFASDDCCSKQLDYLLALYDSYGLPHPPADAALVVFVSGREIRTDFHEKWIFRHVPTLGFSSNERTVLDEFGKTFEVESVKRVEPDPSTLKGVPLGVIEDAVQYHARGWKALARATFRTWMAERTYWPAENHLRWNAWHYWIQRLRRDPDTPLATVAKRLKQIHPDFPPGWKREHRKLLNSLDAALKPRNSKPGSDEALVDALIEARGWEPFESSRLDGFRSDPRYRALLRRGLDAVPVLSKHLDDDRLVRCYSHVCGCNEDLRVRHIVFDILMQIRGGPIIGGWRGVLDNDVPKDWPVEVEKWYAEARKLGEEKYILSRLFSTDEGEEQFRPGQLWLIADKYPQRLPDVFRKGIDAYPHSLFAWKYAKVVAGSKLPDADKKKALEFAATQNEPRTRAAGIYYLRRFDPKLAKERLLHGLKNPEEPREDDAVLAFIVAEGTDPDEWKALAIAIRRASASRQIDTICAVLCATTPGAQKDRLAFLTEFLTDEASAAAPKDHRTRAETRHFAETQLAALLQTGPKPDPTDPNGVVSWVEFRDYVKEALGR